MEVNYTVEPEDSYLDAALNTTLQIHLDEGPGDILVFLTGQQDIESLARLLLARFVSTAPGAGCAMCLVLAPSLGPHLS